MAVGSDPTLASINNSSKAGAGLGGQPVQRGNMHSSVLLASGMTAIGPLVLTAVPGMTGGATAIEKPSRPSAPIAVAQSSAAQYRQDGLDRGLSGAVAADRAADAHPGANAIERPESEWMDRPGRIERPERPERGGSGAGQN